MTLHDLPATTPQRARLTVDDFLLLDRAGAFANYAKTELLDGEILVMNAQYSRHARAQRMLFEALKEGCAGRLSDHEVFFELSVRLDDSSMAQPDLMIVRNAPPDGPAIAADVALIVEVSDSSSTFDLGPKAKLYARAGIPEYWVVDVRAGTIHQMWDVQGETYRQRRQYEQRSVLVAATLALVVTVPDFNQR